MQYAVDPAALTALARQWDAVADMLGTVRTRIPPDGLGTADRRAPLEVAVAGLCEELWDVVTRAATESAAAAADLDAAAVQYASADRSILAELD